MSSGGVSVLTAEEVGALLAACGRGAVGVRNRALILVGYRAGLRCAESLALLPGDLDWQAGTIRVRCGKMGKGRVVGLDDGSWPAIRLWLQLRQGWGAGPRDPVFCTRQGRPLAGQYVRLLLPRLAARAGIFKRVHYHALRHTFASELVREGCPLNLVQQALGHASLKTTDIYVRHVCPQELIDWLRSRTLDGRRDARRDACRPRKIAAFLAGCAIPSWPVRSSFRAGVSGL